MSTEPLTIHIPFPLYQYLKQRAEEAQRSIEEETLQVLATVVPAEEALPPDLAAAMDSLEAFDDAALWEAARQRLPQEAGVRLQELHARKGQGGLSGAESQQLADLVRQYERTMLVRARAAAVLKGRGHDVSDLLRP